MYVYVDAHTLAFSVSVLASLSELMLPPRLWYSEALRSIGATIESRRLVEARALASATGLE